MNPEIARYLIMMQLSAPIAANTTTYMPIFNEGNTAIEMREHSSFETSQLIFNKVLSKFAEDKIQYKGLLGENENLADLYFSKAIELLSPLYPDNIVFSLTHSDSLYFRIYKGNKEITLEVFYSQYDAEDDIEAVVSIYKGEILEKKDFGKLEDVFNNLIYPKNSADHCITPVFEYA